MLATDFYLSFDFQHTQDKTASGYVADTGKAYSKQTSSLSFGWNKDNRSHARNRHTDQKLRYDTIAFMGIGDSASKWEVALPTGLYEVGVVAGDAKYADGTYAIKAEGSTVINESPTQEKKFAKGYSQVWVSDGRLTLSSGTTAVGNKLVSLTVRKLEQSTANSATTKPTPKPTAPVTLPPPNVGGNNGGSSANISNRYAVSGIVNNEMPASQAIPIMKSMGMKSVRIWYGINSFNAAINMGKIREAAAYKAAGMSVTVAFVSKQVADPASVKSFFQRLVNNGEVKNAVDYWEIGNEMNMHEFWNSSLQSYVSNFLKPSYEALHPAGEKVIGGGVSWDVNAAKQLNNFGYTNYCDYAGFHPYGESGAIVAERIKGAKAAFNNKPMIVTEWNVQFVSDPTKWSKEITIAAQALAQNTYLSYYYALKVDGTHVGRGGAVYSNGTKNSLFYNAIKSWTA
jgi:hypothetical protein